MLINQLSHHLKLSPDIILGDSRKKEVCLARALLFWIERNSGYTLQAIGTRYHRTHASVLNAINNINNAIEIKDKHVTALANKVKYLIVDKNMSDLKQVLELKAPATPFATSETKQATMQCAYCLGAGYFYNGGYDEKFKHDLNAPNHKPCAVCKGTGEVSAVINIEWVSHGEVKEVQE